MIEYEKYARCRLCGWEGRIEHCLTNDDSKWLTCPKCNGVVILEDKEIEDA